MRAYRIVKERYRLTAFDGEGAYLYGGRWNSPGNRAVYLSETRALATLEILVNLPSHKLQNYILFECEISDNKILTLDKKSISGNWRKSPASSLTKDEGDRFLQKARYPGMRVPSVIIPEEYNIILNPVHSDFSQVKILNPVAFSIDPRLTGSKR